MEKIIIIDIIILIIIIIGQTCRFLHTRMLEHTRSIKNYNSNSTALAQHAYKFKHNFDFKEVKILEHEQN